MDFFIGEYSHFIDKNSLVNGEIINQGNDKIKEEK
jgi:hypothetical protein